MEQKRTIHISVFTLLDRIREKYGFTYADWSRASGTYPPRISELKRMAGRTEKGKAKAGKIGREFNLGKCAELADGLIVLLGPNELQTAILKFLGMVKPTRDRILLMTLSLSEEKEAQLEPFLRHLLATPLEGGPKQLTKQEIKWLDEIRGVRKARANVDDVLKKIRKAHKQGIDIAAILDIILPKK